MSAGCWAVLLCNDCGPQTQPLAFPQLVEQLVLLGKEIYFEQRKDLRSKIIENPGWMFFLNTISFLSCVSVQVCIHGFLVFLGQGVLPCRFRDPNTKWGQLGMGHLHCWAPPSNLEAKLGIVSFAPIDQYQQRWASLQCELEQLIQLLMQILPWRSLSLPTAL